MQDRSWLRLIHPQAEADVALAERLEALRRSYAEAPDGIDTPQQESRLAALRAELARRGLDGFVVPLSDEHQGEYVARRSQRLAWLTGFTGSAGMAIVLAERAALFVDGRYTLQAAAQVDGSLYEHRHITEEPPDAWLREHLAQGAALGYDPRLHGTRASRDRLAAPCRAVGASLVPCEDNPIDALWADQPPVPLGPIAPHPARFAGAEANEKRQTIAARLAEKGAAAAVLSAPDSIAWLLNVRGADVANSPLPHSFAIVHGDGDVDWFVDRRKLLPEVPAHLGNAVHVQAPETMASVLDGLAGAGKAVLIDEAATPVWMVDRLTEGGAKVIRGSRSLRAAQGLQERRGARRHPRRPSPGRRGADPLPGLARGLPARLDHRARRGRPAGGDARRRRALPGPELRHHLGRRPQRRHRPLPGDGEEQPHAGAGHALPRRFGRAVPGRHHRRDPHGRDRPPEPEHRDRFTRVLRGHIALATARFPRGTTGAQLDTLARQFLWQAGLDYDHGTGHGVGHYLNVHEGPQRISRMGSGAALAPGMVVSNEPGYYKTGAYGIRIENLVAVTNVDDLRRTASSASRR